MSLRHIQSDPEFQLAEDLFSLLWSRSHRAGQPAPAIVARRQAELLQAFIARGEKIRLVLPAFPAKSPNRLKTLGPRPDMAEWVALRNLQDLADCVRNLYEPGAEILLCFDGHLFSDLTGLSDDEVEAYSGGIRRMIAEEGHTSIATFDLGDAKPGCEPDAGREFVTSLYGPSLEEIRVGLSQDQGTLDLFNGLHRILFEDLAYLEPTWSASRRREHARELAYAVFRRSQAWSRYLESTFAGALRLSIHPQPRFSRKIGTVLVPSKQVWRTPWHAVYLQDESAGHLVRREEAEARGAELVSFRDRYAYFRMPGARGDAVRF